MTRYGDSGDSAIFLLADAVIPDDPAIDKNGGNLACVTDRIQCHSSTVHHPLPAWAMTKRRGGSLLLLHAFIDDLPLDRHPGAYCIRPVSRAFQRVPAVVPGHRH